MFRTVKLGVMTADPTGGPASMAIQRLKPSSWQVAAIAVVFAVLTGSLADRVTTALGIFPRGSVLVITLVGVFLWRKQSAIGAIGSGLYVTALLLLLGSIAYLLPLMVIRPIPEHAHVLSIFLFGVGSLLGAIVVAVIGYLVKREEKVENNQRG